LIDVSATYEGVEFKERVQSCPAPPELLIDTAHPEDSVFIRKLEGTQTCGQPMPGQGVRISKWDTECLLNWAASIASSDGGLCKADGG
jgi:hypothetical protein